MNNIYLTVQEAAERLQVSARTVQRWIRRGTFPHAEKLNPDLSNSPFRIPVQDIKDFLQRRK